MPDPVVILGLGFTTTRLARRLRERGVQVSAAVRAPSRYQELVAAGIHIQPLTPDNLPKGGVLVHSIPPVPEPDKSAIRSLIQTIVPARILYISSTGVYGARSHVDENTPPAPNDEKGIARIDDEQWLASQAPTLVLRSAAIYGPGRGVHVRLREGKTLRSPGGLVSRIHVDDLAAILDAATESKLQGAWPVGDDLPASSDHVMLWCAQLMGLNVPKNTTRVEIAGRNVDGRKIRNLLGLKLKYPDYKSGIPASLLGE